MTTGADQPLLEEYAEIFSQLQAATRQLRRFVLARDLLQRPDLAHTDKEQEGDLPIRTPVDGRSRVFLASGKGPFTAEKVCSEVLDPKIHALDGGVHFLRQQLADLSHRLDQTEGRRSGEFVEIKERLEGDPAATKASTVTGADRRAVQRQAGLERSPQELTAEQRSDLDKLYAAVFESLDLGSPKTEERPAAPSESTLVKERVVERSAQVTSVPDDADYAIHMKQVRLEYRKKLLRRQQQDQA